jgi:CRISPR-associated protein Csb2
MTAIKIIFPWGRYYAHPWGLNPVRLREAEWPPSPWRLLRALASSWFHSHPGCTLSQDAVTLIESLARAVPEIGIGRVTFGQTIHYQPNYGATAERDDARYKNTRHENHFVAVHGPVVYRWPEVELPSIQQKLLADTLAEMSYFGRAESICHAEPIAAAEIEAIEGIGWCRPTSGRRISARCRDVFCPNPADFRVTDLWARRVDSPSVESQNAPKHLVDALLSGDMKPDGAQWLSYKMPEDWPESRVVRTPHTANRQLKPVNEGPRIAHYLRFSLQCRVPVHPKFTVPIAEHFRSEASRYFVRQFGGDHLSFALFGHHEDRPSDVTGEHQHAFYLPTGGFGDHGNLQEPGSITELHVWCPYGFTQAETQILLRIQRLIWKDGRYPVRPILTAMSLQPPVGMPLAIGVSKSRIWRSATPFVPPRHFYRKDRGAHKMRDAESPERQLIGCLRRAGVIDSGAVRRLGFSGERLETVQSLPPMPLWSIVRAPEGEQVPFDDAVVSPVHVNGSGVKSEPNCQRMGFFMEIAFETEVALPIPAFGHSSHFGLGVFLPVG